MISGKLGLYTLLVLLYFVNLFMHHPVMDCLLGILAAAALLVSFRDARWIYRIMGVLFITAGIWIHRHAGLEWAEVATYVSSNMLLVSLLFVLPFINTVIRVGGYQEAVKQWVRKQADRPERLYIRGITASYVLCLFLFFAAIPTVYEVLKKTVSNMAETVREKFVHRVILRGFATATVWSPFEVMIPYVAGYTGIGYLQLLPWILIFSVFLLGTEWAGAIRYKGAVAVGTFNGKVANGEIPAPNAPEPPDADSTVDSASPVQAFSPVVITKKIAALLAGLGTFMMLSALFSRMSALSFFETVAVLLLPFSALWALCIQKGKIFWVRGFHDWKQQTASLENLVLLFLSIGFFNETFLASGLTDPAGEWLSQTVRSPLVLFLSIQFLSLLLPFAGFHPLLTIGLLGLAVQPFLHEINPVSISLVILTSNLAPDASGTYNTTVTMMSNLTGVNPYRISWWNVGFSLFYGSVGVMLALLLL